MQIESQEMMAFVIFSPGDWALLQVDSQEMNSGNDGFCNIFSPGDWAPLQAGFGEAPDWWRQEQGTQTRTQRLQPENSQKSREIVEIKPNLPFPADAPGSVSGTRL